MQSLYLNLQVTHFVSPSEMLLKNCHNKLAMNLALSINCNLRNIVFMTSMGSEKVMYVNFSLQI